MRCSLLALLVACSDYDLAKDPDGLGAAAPAILVEPARLDFWDVGSNEVEVLPFTVRSVGSGLLIVDEILLPASGDFVLLAGGAGFELEPGASLEVEVAFTPTSRDAQEDVVTVMSNDPVLPEAPVELAGAGRLPWLVIAPASHDYGDVPVGCDDSAQFVLQNVGEEDLVVSEVAVNGDAQVALVDDPGGFTLVPGAYATVDVQLDATVVGAFVAALDVASNDPRGIVSAPVSGSPTAADLVEETWDLMDEPPVDVLFAVDQSCSMDADAASLGENFAGFLEAIEAQTTGWQVGVVTLDDGCVNGGVLDASVAERAELFASGAALGDDADIADDEALFQIVDRALAEAAVGGCNEGLLRDEARLHVIVVSDEPERSPEQASAWTWAWWVADFQAYAEDLVISGVVDLDGCGEGAENYLDAITATGGEAVSVCSDDWAAHVAALATATVTGLWSFPLAQAPADGSLAVTLDGVEATGWTWDDEANAVVFETRPSGQQVTATYAVAEACP